jgi:GT2 family glycosyltransferase
LAAFVNYDGAPMTLAAVTSLRQQLGAVGVRIVVVDNGSTPADVEALTAGLPGGVSLVRLKTNRGYGAACNAAARIAAESGIPYVWWLNNDLTFETGASDALLAHMEATPTVAAAGAVTVDEETGRRVLGAGMDLTLWRGRVRHRHTGIDVKQLPSQPYSVDVISASCILVRVSALRVIGGIDEGYFMYSEDVDWSVRARAAGFGLDIVPRARARHGGARSSKPQDRLRYMMRNRIRMVRARAGLAVQLAFMGYFVVGWLPAYTVGRLMPRFGLREGLLLALSPLTWNVRDALRYRRWRLRPEDLVIPRF